MYITICALIHLSVRSGKGNIYRGKQFLIKTGGKWGWFFHSQVWMLKKKHPPRLRRPCQTVCRYLAVEQNQMLLYTPFRRHFLTLQYQVNFQVGWPHSSTCKVMRRAYNTGQGRLNLLNYSTDIRGKIPGSITLEDYRFHCDDLLIAQWNERLRKYSQLLSLGLHPWSTPTLTVQLLWSGKITFTCLDYNADG